MSSFTPPFSLKRSGLRQLSERLYGFPPVAAAIWIARRARSLSLELTECLNDPHAVTVENDALHSR